MTYYKSEEVKQLVETAVEKISSYKTANLFVSMKRAVAKAGKLEPTDNQARILRYITTHKHVSFEESLGMDWRYLGGLFTRGLVEWGYDEGGVYGVKPSTKGTKGGK